MSFGYNFFHLAKVLATTNSGPGLALNVGPDLDQKLFNSLIAIISVSTRIF